MNRASAQVIAIVTTTIMATMWLTGCTPKPLSAQPVIDEFMQHMSATDFAAAAHLTDQPDTVTQVWETTWNGLQAEALHVDVHDITIRDSVATAAYTMTWQLPRDRKFTYGTTMTLNRINDQWVIRWQPTVLHPKLGANQHLELQAINAQRASVVSSDGSDILVPGSVDRILVDTHKMTDATRTARAIAAALTTAKATDHTLVTIDPADLAKKLAATTGNYSVTTIPKTIAPTIRDQLQDDPAIIFHEEAAMVSKDPGFAPDIIARVAGLVNNQLDGSNGWRIAIVTHDGAPIEDLEHHEPKVAPAVQVSLDRKVQLAAEEAVNQRKEMKAMIVAIRPSSGEILAVAQTDKADEDGAVALSGQFPPGSTFKIITAAAGLQDQHLTPESIVPCPGTMNLYGRQVTNYNMFSLGNVPLQKAFARSCNTTFANISTQLQQGQLQDMGKQFGLGVDYDIPGLTTITGSIPEGKTELEKTEAGYGQGLTLVSPFGLALVSATAAHGSTPTPRLVSGFETKTNEKVSQPAPETIEQLRSLMGAVTEAGGTAGGIRAGGKIYGKTGEAEITGGSHAWFTGYRDDIAFATLIVMGGGSESSVAVTDKFFTRLDELRSAPQQQDTTP